MIHQNRRDVTNTFYELSDTRNEMFHELTNKMINFFDIIRNSDWQTEKRHKCISSLSFSCLIN